MIEDMVRSLGAEHIEVFADSIQARDYALRGDIDCAILDLMEQGRPSFEIADILDEQGIPFVFSTGAALDEVEERHRDRPFLSKPFGEADLKAELCRALERGTRRQMA